MTDVDTIRHMLDECAKNLRLAERELSKILAIVGEDDPETQT